MNDTISSDGSAPTLSSISTKRYIYARGYSLDSYKYSIYACNRSNGNPQETNKKMLDVDKNKKIIWVAPTGTIKYFTAAV